MISKREFPWDDEKQIKIDILLNWTKWYNWDELETIDINSFPTKSGVYEVRTSDLKKCYDIGKAENIRRRVLRSLILGDKPHSTRKRMLKEGVNLKNLRVRWVETEYPAALEEYLHLWHKKVTGNKPLFVKRT